MSRYLVHSWNLCSFALFLHKFGCHGNCPCSPENSDSIFEFVNPENLLITRWNFSISCSEVKSLAILAYFGLNLVTLATPFPPLKIWIVYLNAPPPKTAVKFLDILCANEISAILAYFCPNLVAMATPFPPLIIWILEFADPVIHVKNFWLSCMEQKLVQFGLLCPNSVAMATPFAPLKIQIAYLNSSTPKILP